MYTATLTLCALIAIFGALAVVTEIVLDRLIGIEEEEGIEYGRE